MKKYLLCLGLILTMGLFAVDASETKYHKEKLPDPKGFNAHFPDMDLDGDDMISGKEFTEYFPQTEQMIFEAIDLNDDGNIDHDEWHQFKEAHGLKHKE